MEKKKVKEEDLPEKLTKVQFDKEQRKDFAIFKKMVGEVKLGNYKLDEKEFIFADSTGEMGFGSLNHYKKMEMKNEERAKAHTGIDAEYLEKVITNFKGRIKAFEFKQGKPAAFLLNSGVVVLLGAKLPLEFSEEK